MKRWMPDRQTQYLRGVTLVEVLIAALVLATLLVGTMNMFMVTSRQATSNEALTNSGVLAQIVVERLRAKIEMNPRYFRDLMAGKKSWMFTGTIVDPASAINPDNLKLSPFFEHLFTRGSAELYTDPNKISIAPATDATATGMKPEELGAMLTSFRDHQVTIIIQDDVDIENPAAPTPFAEVLKVITVTVARTSAIEKSGNDPLAFSLSSHVICPADSLSVEALQALSNRFAGMTLEEMWNEFFLIAGDNPYIKTTVLKLPYKCLLADAFIILAGANNESLLTTGEYIPGSTVVNVANGAQFLDHWIQQFSAADAFAFSSSKAELAKLYSRKAVVIFNTFGHIRLPLQHLTDNLLGPVLVKVRLLAEKLAKSEKFLASFQKNAATGLRQFDQDQQRVQSAQSALDPNDPGSQSELDAALAAKVQTQGELSGLKNDFTGMVNTSVQTFSDDFETLVFCSFLQQFYEDPKYAPVAVRPKDYAQRFITTLDSFANTLSAHLDQADGTTPYDKLQASLRFVDATVSRQLYQRTNDGAAQARIKTLSTLYTTKMAELSQYLKEGDVYDVGALAARSPAFWDRAEALKHYSEKYRQMVTTLQPGGEIAQFLARYDSFFGNVKIEQGTTIGEIDKAVNDK